ncbi:MAG: response regulator transcription factor [Deltaproteobacteria bacterium]|nr:response regulator transcription factor [Deltaproteobacteria bacterium]
MKTLLLVEDDKNLADSLRAFLGIEGFEIRWASCLRDARRVLDESIDLVILDWTLPDGPGIDLLRELPGRGLSTPVVLLTSRADLVDKVLGLELGANDYVVKPFEPRELLARLRVQLRLAERKPRLTQLPSIEVAGISLSTSTREVRFRGELVSLTRQEHSLLEVLLSNPNRVFSRTELLEQAWGYESYPTTRTVDTHIVQLRQKFDASMFETVRGIGYRLKV